VGGGGAPPPAVRLGMAAEAPVELLATFHTPGHLERVARRCAAGQGFLDGGDTPALPGIDRAASVVVGASADAMERIMSGEVRHAFNPIGGLHHAGRDHAAGFCVYNDIGVVIELLRRRHGLRRVAYVDMDAHHGDGVFYAYESDPDLLFADIHEDGQFLYPGTGDPTETGRGPAEGTKLNIALAPADGDEEFFSAWPEVLAYLDAGRPEFILLQCGADSVAGDPITHLRLSPGTHGRAAADLRRLAERHCDGRLLALGGGGYNRRNLALAWSAVVEALAAP
ncbi:MAG: acetoin utilization protein AcuC, partial [Chromatiales bacterium]|nr:acetoin utilization protein AcuC [Chromatiales bacterium]